MAIEVIDLRKFGNSILTTYEDVTPEEALAKAHEEFRAGKEVREVEYKRGMAICTPFACVAEAPQEEEDVTEPESTDTE